MVKAKKLLVFVVFLLYFASFAYGQNYGISSGEISDTAASGEVKIKFNPYSGVYNICENEEKIIPIRVDNKDAASDTQYSLSVLGADWATPNVKEFALRKKQSGVIFLDLRPGDDTKGRYKINVAVSSASGIRRELILDIDVQKCTSLSLELEAEYGKVCGGTKIQYNGRILNNGRKQSDIKLKINGPNWVSLEESAFSVPAGSKQGFQFNADIPSNAKGIFNLGISAFIEGLPSISSERNIRLESVPKYECYRADIISADKIKNYYSDSYTLVKIRNSGTRQADYDASVDGPPWVSIEPKKLAVNPQQFGNLNLNINPNPSIPEGVYAAKIKIKFEDAVYSKDVSISLIKENEALKNIKLFFIFYKYYIYAALLAMIIIFFSRRKVLNAIGAKYKAYKTKKSRLRALELARKARHRTR